MANALDRDIQPGEVVVVRLDSIRPDLREQLRDPQARRFCCERASGTAIHGRWLIDDEESPIGGDDIDAEETARLTHQDDKRRGC